MPTLTILTREGTLNQHEDFEIKFKFSIGDSAVRTHSFKTGQPCTSNIVVTVVCGPGRRRYAAMVPCLLCGGDADTARVSHVPCRVHSLAR